MKGIDRLLLWITVPERGMKSQINHKLWKNMTKQTRHEQNFLVFATLYDAHDTLSVHSRDKIYTSSEKMKALNYHLKLFPEECADAIGHDIK